MELTITDLLTLYGEATANLRILVQQNQQLATRVAELEKQLADATADTKDKAQDGK